MPETTDGNGPKDITGQELIEQVNEILNKRPNANIYVKWTCPNCGDRVTCDTPNTFYTGGFLHDECGHLYTGDAFGYMLIASADGSEE